jgi:hypothetical protein
VPVGAVCYVQMKSSSVEGITGMSTGKGEGPLKSNGWWGSVGEAISWPSLMGLSGGGVKWL